jgi:hypothetical protein
LSEAFHEDTGWKPLRVQEMLALSLSRQACAAKCKPLVFRCMLSGSDMRTAEVYDMFTSKAVQT